MKSNGKIARKNKAKQKEEGLPNHLSAILADYGNDFSEHLGGCHTKDEGVDRGVERARSPQRSLRGVAGKGRGRLGGRGAGGRGLAITRAKSPPLRGRGSSSPSERKRRRLARGP